MQPTNRELSRKTYSTLRQEKTPHTEWAIDIIKAKEGAQYIAAVVDVSNRKIISKSTSKKPDYQLVTEAITAALQHQKDLDNLLLHTDRSPLFTSKEFRSFLVSHGIATRY